MRLFQRFCFSLVLLFFTNCVSGQDSLYTRKVISKLCSKSFAGRGYIKHGDKKAANFIRKEFIKAGLNSGADNYFQDFSFPVNTFPSKCLVSIDNKKLIAGKDYIVDAATSGLKGNFKIKYINNSPAFYKDADLKDSILLIDTTGNGKIFSEDSVRLWYSNPLKAKGLIFIKETKLTWSISTNADAYFSMYMLREALSKSHKRIKLNVQNNFVASHETQNVIAIIPGTAYPDSFIFITAHYDHLGKMGSKTYFPGANDNASGISMLLNYAHYFNQPANRLKYTVVFIAFAGEEAGLLGSLYYTETRRYH